MPQWQGGDYDLSVPTRELYPLGARIIALLAPKSEAPIIEVPIEEYTGAPHSKQNGVVQQDVVIRQLRSARRIIDEHAPDRIIMFGGDYLVDQAPFSYLSERYQDKLGILWLDAHPDISTPNIHDCEHAMVLGNLMAEETLSLLKKSKFRLKATKSLLLE